MTSVDQFLLKLVSNNSSELESSIPNRDFRVLNSLCKNIKGNTFITLNQSKLLLKIFTENKKALEKLSTEFIEVLENPTWSQQFRPVDTTKKIYSAKINDDTLVLCIEFAFSTELRKKLQSLSKELTGLMNSGSGKLFYADFTEKNIVSAIDNLKTLGFTIEEKLQEYYNSINLWKKTDIEDQFVITNITHDNFQKHITADLGINTAIDENILRDRSIRYQYFLKTSEKTPENLVEKIAYRNSSKVWVNSTETPLEEIINSLTSLKRFPVLVVFDSYNSIETTKSLKNLSEILEKNGITEDIGIYFRLENSETGKEFNQIIKDKKYNCQLSATTKVVGVQSGKIPKFLLKSEWKPMAVLSVNTNLRQSKTAVYANCCDLIISYTEKEPIYEHKVL